MRKYSLPTLCVFVLSLLAIPATAAPTVAAEAPKYVSATFAEIQSRVLTRDAESGAILYVKPKADAPGGHRQFRFEIRREHDEAIVTIESMPMMIGGKVYEQYLLRIDDAIEAELASQDKRVQLQLAREKKYREEATRRIKELSGGALHYGMTQRDVEKAMGAPDRIEYAQAAFNFTMHYPTCRLAFGPEGLTDMQLKSE